MKKLIIASMIACAAVVTYAGTATWGSGTLYAPNEDGSLSSTKVTSAAFSSVVAYVWESTSSAFTYDAGSLYTWYANGASSTKDPFGGTIAALTGSKTAGANSTSVSVAGTESADAGVSIYSAVLYVLKDSEGEDAWYMENSAYVAAKSGTAKASISGLGSYVGGGTSGEATSWTAATVPEPTSGLLLLLGMAGMALKRKHA